MEIARELNVDNVLVVNAKIGADEKLTYTGYMVNKESREFKKSEAVFAVPEKGYAAKSASLKEFNKALIDDPYEYKSVSDVFAAEVEMITSDGAQEQKAEKDNAKTPIYKEWWLWTVVGVVAAAGIVLAVDAATGNGIDLFGATGGNKSKGATLDIDFQ